MITKLALIAALLFILNTSSVAASLVDFSGTDLKGGAAELYGPIFGSEAYVNLIYAEPTGSRSFMTATFTVDAIPADPMFLYVKGHDDDGPNKCKILIEINSHTLFDGPNDFSETAWLAHAYPIPNGVLKPAQTIYASRAARKKGRLAMPPWFQVSRIAVAGKSFDFTTDFSRNFRVKLPTELRDFPRATTIGQATWFQMARNQGLDVDAGAVSRRNPRDGEV